MKLILSSCYLGVYVFEKGVQFLGKWGVHVYKKILNNIGEGFTLLRSGFTFKKGGFTFIKTL